MLASSCSAAQFVNGATAQVKPDSIWFQKPAELAQWQRLKNGGNAAAMTAYQEKMLSEREAWEFLNPLSVKVLGYYKRRRQVSVKMLTPGRFEGEDWILDADSFAP
jgi:hypothetical protein